MRERFFPNRSASMSLAADLGLPILSEPGPLELAVRYKLVRELAQSLISRQHWSAAENVRGVKTWM